MSYDAKFDVLTAIRCALKPIPAKSTSSRIVHLLQSYGLQEKGEPNVLSILISMNSGALQTPRGSLEIKDALL